MSRKRNRFVKSCVVFDTKGFKQSTIDKIEETMMYIGDYKKHGHLYAELVSSKNKTIRILFDRIKFVDKCKVIDTGGLDEETISKIEVPMNYVCLTTLDGDRFAKIANSKHETITIFHERLEFL